MHGASTSCSGRLARPGLPAAGFAESNQIGSDLSSSGLAFGRCPPHSTSQPANMCSARRRATSSLTAQQDDESSGLAAELSNPCSPMRATKVPLVSLQQYFAREGSYDNCQGIASSGGLRAPPIPAFHTEAQTSINKTSSQVNLGIGVKLPAVLSPAQRLACRAQDTGTWVATIVNWLARMRKAATSP